MVITFEEDYLRELYEEGTTRDKKHRYQPHIIKGYQRRVDMLAAAPRPETLYQFSSLNFEALRGEKSGRYSVRVNDQYRVEVTLEEDGDAQMITICNIVELSNHYK